MPGDMDDLSGRLLVRRRRYHQHTITVAGLAMTGAALGLVLAAFLLWP